MKSRILAVAMVGVLGLCAAEVPHILAHRGNMQYDDNALGGFKQSLEAGVTGFETDVQMTSDGGFVLMHNDTVDGTTDGTGNVKDMTLAQVTALKLKKSKENVPTLQDLANLFQNRSDVYVEFEMKSQEFTGDTLNNYVDGVYQIVSSTMPAGTYVFTSFKQNYLSAMKTRHPDARVCLILGGKQTDEAIITQAVNLGCFGISPGVETGKSWIDAAKAAGLRVALWMVEDLSTWQSCRAKGADTVTSDHPIQLLNAVNQALAVGDSGTAWTGQRYFTNDVTWTISDALAGTEGLGKWGSGTLNLTGKSTFTGDVYLMGGEINLGKFNDGSNDVVETQVGALGNSRVTRTIVVSNATLRMVGKNDFGGSGRSGTPIKADLKFYDSTLDLTTNFAFNAGNVYLHNTEVKFHGGLCHWGDTGIVSGPNDQAFWGALFANNLYFSGNRAVTFENEKTNLSDKEYRKAAVSLGKWDENGAFHYWQQGEICVPDMTGNSSTDVKFNLPIIWTSGNNGPSSGFRKTGAGTLELANKDDNNSAKWSNYTGNVDVVEGTLKMSAGLASWADNRTSVFGAPRYPHTFTVHPGATLHMAANDLMGQFYATNKITLHVNGGTYMQDQNVNGIGRTIFENATVNFGNQPNEDGSYWQVVSPGVTNQVKIRWPTVGFNQGVTFKGTSNYTLSNANAAYHFGHNYGKTPTELNLDGVDLTIKGRLVDSPPWFNRTWPEDAFHRRYITTTNHPGQNLNMRKVGSGALTLDNVNSETKGRIEITEGTLRMAVRGNNQYVATKSPIGDLSDSNRVALVMSGGVLEFRASDTLGQAACVNNSQIIVSNATIKSTGKWANAFPYLTLYDAKFDYTGGLASGNWNGPYGAFIFAQRVTWDGTRPYNLPFIGNDGYFALGFQDDFRMEERADKNTNFFGKCEFRVMDITKNAEPDVTLGVPLKTQATWTGGPRWGKVEFHCGLLKTGPGTLSLNGDDPQGKYYQEPTRVAEGTLLVDTHKFKSTNVIVQAGAYLGGTGTVKLATLETGAGFTAAPGQTAALTVQNVTLPANNEVAIDVAYVGDVTDVGRYSVPVVTSAGFENAKWKLTYNGGEPPTNYKLGISVRNGVVHARIGRSGMTFLIR